MSVHGFGVLDFLEFKVTVLFRCFTLPFRGDGGEPSSLREGMGMGRGWVREQFVLTVGTKLQNNSTPSK